MSEPWFMHEQRAAERGGMQTPLGWNDDRPAAPAVVSAAADGYTTAVAGLASLARDLDQAGHGALSTRARHIIGHLGAVAKAVAHVC